MDVPSNLRRDSCFYISGDVQVHPSAAIAPGVFLQADSDSRLVVGPNVSIGSGALLHAQGGVLSLAAQVTLGSGVLIMGQGRVGSGACVGANTSLLFKVSVEPGQLVEPGTVIGEPEFGGHWGEQRSDQQQFVEETFVEETVFKAAVEERQSAAEAAPPDTSSPPNSKVPMRPTQVYGRVVVERLRRMMSPQQSEDP